MHDLDHIFKWQHACDVMSDSRCDLTLPRWRQITEQSKSKFTTNCRERISVEEQERSLPVTGFKEVYRFLEGERGLALCFPLRFARRSSFRVNAMLCSTSFARSSIDADDRLPVPVFDKRGSGLKRWTVAFACSRMSFSVR